MSEKNDGVVAQTKAAANAADASCAKIIRVTTEQQAEHNGAFIMLFCRYAQPYLDYDRPIDGPNNQAFPLVLLNCRWDHSFGFPGGKVDPGETLRQAAVREAKEEIGLVVKESKLIPVCSHMKEGGNFAAHLYAVEVTAQQFTDALVKSCQAEDAIAEVMGVIAMRVDSGLKPDGRGIVKFVRSIPMSFSARHELVYALEKLELVKGHDVTVLQEALAAAI